MTLRDELFAGIKAKRDPKNSLTQQMAGVERKGYDGTKPGALTVNFLRPTPERPVTLKTPRTLQGFKA